MPNDRDELIMLLKRIIMENLWNWQLLEEE
jgi:hypothetical protein